MSEMSREMTPDVELLKEWLLMGGCETPCGCWVVPDGTCDHGEASWLIQLAVI